MTVLLWGIIIACFISSFVGLVYPIIPSVVMIWIGFLLYHFFIPNAELSIFFWIGMIVITAVLFLADILSQKYFLKKSGGTTLSDRLGFIAIIIGSFIFPPFGLIIVPFVVVFIAEYFQHRNAKQSLKVSFSSVISFIASTISKLLIQLMMIIIFIIAIFL